MTSVNLFLTLVFLFVAAVYSKCPTGVPTVNCFVDPCSTPAPEGCSFKTCVSNYCGGCNRQFFDEEGTEVCKTTVSHQTTTTTTTTTETEEKRIPQVVNKTTKPKTKNSKKLPVGSACTTTGTDGFPPVRCAKGLYCKITNPGAPEVDVPNGGVCTIAKEGKGKGKGKGKGTGAGKGNRKCGPVCMMFCSNGNVLDKNGCPTCKCNPAPVDSKPNTLPAAAKTVAPGGSCTTSGSRGFPAVPCTPGYYCKITNPGAPEVDVPNRGVCSSLSNLEQDMETEPKAPCGVVCMVKCAFGNVLDENGCSTCQCKPAPAPVDIKPNTLTSAVKTVAPGGSCTTSGSLGFSPVPCTPGYYCKITNHGRPEVDLPNSGVCTSLNTLPKTNCPLLKCAKNCENGYVLTKEGCRTCQCITPDGSDVKPTAAAEEEEIETPKPVSAKPQELETLPKKNCGPLCRMKCIYGNVLDANGCPICKCKPAPGAIDIKPKPNCPLLKCAKNCENGYVLTKEGCRTCQCITPEGSDAKPTPAAVEDTPKKNCGPVCMMFCVNGNVLDANGCPICRCKPAPGAIDTKPKPTSAAKTVAPGGSCTTTGTRGFPAVPCTPGYYCKITNPGRPEVDVPNSGVCTSLNDLPQELETLPKNNCGPLCRMKCIYGNVLDANGCPICKCKPAPGGVEIETKPAPAKTVAPGGSCTTSGSRGFPPVPCSTGYHCKITNPGAPEVDVPNSGVCTANKTPKPVPVPQPVSKPNCGPVCMIFCVNGNVLDANGCPTCKCNPAPGSQATQE